MQGLKSPWTLAIHVSYNQVGHGQKLFLTIQRHKNVNKGTEKCTSFQAYFMLSLSGKMLKEGGRREVEEREAALKSLLSVCYFRI